MTTNSKEVAKRKASVFQADLVIFGRLGARGSQLDVRIVFRPPPLTFIGDVSLVPQTMHPSRIFSFSIPSNLAIGRRSHVPNTPSVGRGNSDSLSMIISGLGVVTSRLAPIGGNNLIPSLVSLLTFSRLVPSFQQWVLELCGFRPIPTRAIPSASGSHSPSVFRISSFGCRGSFSRGFEGLPSSAVSSFPLSR